jgi:hypothetical protein
MFQPHPHVIQCGQGIILQALLCPTITFVFLWLLKLKSFETG